MSFTTKMQSRITRIEELEKALQRIGAAKKQLSRNTTEAKSKIQCNISRQLEALRNREVWLLNQLDTISGVKEEVLQQQSVKLNKILGVLQSSIKYPGGSEDAASKLERMDIRDLQPEETPYVSFKSDPAVLREAVMNYGRIDANSVTGIQSPFMDPDHQAPSLPRHFEDYNDAEHHVLYKTVEELNRTKVYQQEPFVPSICPKLSSRMEDWLMPVTKKTETDTNYSITLPKLSNNLSDWLKSPVCLNREPSTPIDDLSTDASIQTWLHKIKQCTMEEEDDYEFIDHDSETRTQSSELEQFPDPDEEDTDVWLYRTSFKGDNQEQKTNTRGSLDGWLLQSKPTHTAQESNGIDMSRYFTTITNELDKWLLTGATQKQSSTDVKDTSRLNRSTAPSSLDLGPAIKSHVSRVDNPWLLRTTDRSISLSPVSSCRSSHSNFPTKQKVYNKWLLNGGLTDKSESTTKVSCPTMDLFKRNADTLSWLMKTDQNSVISSKNPMANFNYKAADKSLWLKTTFDAPESMTKVESPAKKLFEGSFDNWLHKTNVLPKNEDPALICDNLAFKSENTHKWLTGSLSSFPQHEDDVEEIDL